jgi:hypothetical protein
MNRKSYKLKTSAEDTAAVCEEGRRKGPGYTVELITLT